MDIIDDGSCFACGRLNTHGLQLQFRLDAGQGTAVTEVALPSHFGGWREAVHGGIVATMLDEAMVYACGALGQYVATATLNVRFRKPVPLQTMLRIEGRVTGRRARFLRAESRLLVNGRVLAQASGALAVMRAVTDDDPLKARLNVSEPDGPPPV